MSIMRRKKTQEPEKKLLDINADMQGTLTFKDNVHLLIRGTFQGYLDSKGLVELSEGARVKGDIRTDDVLLAGAVDGNIFAHQSVQLKSTAVVKGDIQAQAMSVELGAVIEGKCCVKSFESLGENVMTIQDVAEYLSVEQARVEQWVRKQQIPSEQINGHVVIEKNHVDAWVKSQQMVVR